GVGRVSLEPGVGARHGACRTHLSKSSVRIRPRQAEGLAEHSPVSRRIKIRVFEDHDRLAFTCVAGREYRIQIVNGANVSRDERMKGAVRSVVRVLTPWNQ